jgi:aminotransferase
MLEAAGLKCIRPSGAYYVMADIGRFGMSDTAFAKYLVEHIGVAAVPASSFYLNPADGISQIRFCFCKKYETLAAAGEKLARLSRQ